MSGDWVVFRGTNEEIVAAWIARSWRAGRNYGGTLFFEDRTIYSYGWHFPIARRLGGFAVLFNPGRYSPTTSRHQNLVRRACEGLTVYDCPPNEWDAKEQELIEKAMRQIEYGSLSDVAC